MSNKEQIFLKAEWSLIFTIIGTGVGVLAAMISMFLWIRSEANADRRELFSAIDKIRSELIASIDTTRKELTSVIENDRKELQSAVDKAITYTHSQMDHLKNENQYVREKVIACEIAVGNIKDDHKEICVMQK